MDVASRYDDDDKDDDKLLPHVPSAVLSRPVRLGLVLGRQALTQGVRGLLPGRDRLGDEEDLAGEDGVASVRLRGSSFLRLIGDSTCRKGLIPTGFFVNPKPGTAEPSFVNGCIISKPAIRSSTLNLFVPF